VCVFVMWLRNSVLLVWLILCCSVMVLKVLVLEFICIVKFVVV